MMKSLVLFSLMAVALARPSVCTVQAPAPPIDKTWYLLKSPFDRVSCF